MSSTPFDARAFDAAWNRYVAAATKAYPSFTGHLHRGAAPDVIGAAERAIGYTFSPDLRHLLGRHNGGDTAFVLPGWEFFSAERIVDEWKVWEDLYRTQFKPEGYRCEPSGPIRDDEWWRLKWIPFCGDGGGNHLCLDMEPALGGTVGQVITMWHDDATRALIAPSLAAFVAQIASDFEQGKLTWQDDMGGVYEADV